MSKVLVHIVTWNSAETITSCIERARAQSGFTLGENLRIRVTDNASSDNSARIVEAMIQPGITLVSNSSNMGFCGAHNQGVEEFLRGDYQSLLILNPDVGLQPGTLRAMTRRLDDKRKVGIVTPKLLRALSSLEAIHPPALDAAGMILTRSLRHFDRGAGEWDRGQFERGEFMFGGTGACLLVSRACVTDMCLPSTIPMEPVQEIYPQLAEGLAKRPQLFDEAFFAYREDADLSWRARRLGWKCWYEPSAVANHVRFVTPERRKALPEVINSYSVRNRFLLQINNWSWRDGILSFFLGIIVRNAIVIAGVVFQERASLKGLREAWMLMPRARQIRQWVRSRRVSIRVSSPK
jgi:GT2 family glycosyltransferase